MANYGTAVLKEFPWPQGFDTTDRNIIIRGTISITNGGNPGALYPGAGFPLSWGAVQNLTAGLASSGGSTISPVASGYAVPQIDSVKGTVVKLPTEVDVWSSQNPPSGFNYTVDRSSGNLHILVVANGASGNSGPMIEYGGTLTTQMLNDVIQFCAVFPKHVF
jgi:hypothetical protein